ncbi:MAG: methyl-accepting chemotaxis protein [Granulosicoccaceae bacterium]
MKRLLVISMLLAGLVPLVSVTVVSGLQAQSLFEQEANNRIISLLESRKAHMEDYLNNLIDMNATLAGNNQTVDALIEFDESFNKLGELDIASYGLPAEGVQQSVSDYYSRVFSEAYQESSGDTLAIDSDKLVPNTKSGLMAQWLYIVKNANPLGEKDRLTRSEDGSSYSDIHARYHKYFREIQQRYGLYDVFLIDAKKRNVVYSVFKETDFGLDLRQSELSNSGLARVVERAIASPQGGPVFEDMSRYLPSYSAPAAFFATPLLKEGEVVGVLATQVPSSKVEQLTMVEAGMGETGQALLVGDDGYLRAQPRLDKSPAVLEVKLDNLSLNRARGGETGVMIEEADEASKYIGFAPIDIPGIDWSLLIELDESEVLASSHLLLMTSVAMFGFAAVVILFIAWRISSLLYRAIGGDPSEVRLVAEGISGGDLSSKESDAQREGAYAAIVGMRDALRKVLLEVADVSADVRNGAQDIASGNLGLSQRTEQQAADLQQTASSMEEITVTVKRNADNANAAYQLATSTLSRAEVGGELGKKTVVAMDEIAESSTKIADIITVIDEIAFQTNLLALNAAVEAARAGEQGRGFSVVASEVRQLAGRSAAAAKEIKDLIEESVSKVSQGSELVKNSGEELSSMIAAVAELSGFVQRISTASSEQSLGIEEINKALIQLDQTTQQNTALVEQAASTSEVMSVKSADLANKISFFKVA